MGRGWGAPGEVGAAGTWVGLRLMGDGGRGADRHTQTGIDVQEGKGLRARVVGAGAASGLRQRLIIRVRAGLFTRISMRVVHFCIKLSIKLEVSGGDGPKQNLRDMG